MNKRFMYVAMISGVALSLTMTGCHAVKDNNQASLSPTVAPPNVKTSQQTLTQQALHIQKALAEGDYAAITDDIHPTRGVRFSMYAYIQPKADKTFSRDQYAQYLRQSKIRFTWGEKDGTGDLLITTLPDYLRHWVNASVFGDNPAISVNNSQAVGNSINNLNKIYQNSDYVEFYKDGSVEYSGMDWRAMRLVFDEYQGKRYLVAIISDQWTI
ncbi:hypothetical protein M0N77_05140 [Psychrobacter sp. AH5]|uniref:hypothetical protein n=1 Tax=Psychrobacter sp. AH5 TaxID=2937433 RepID=UPI0033422B40